MTMTPEQIAEREAELTASTERAKKLRAEHFARKEQNVYTLASAKAPLTRQPIREAEAVSAPVPASRSAEEEGFQVDVGLPPPSGVGTARPEPSKFEREWAEEQARRKGEGSPQPSAPEPDLEEPDPEPEPEPSSTALIVVERPGVPKGAAEPEVMLEFMNRKHAVVANVGSKTIISSVVPSELDPEQSTVIFQKPEDFRLQYANRKVRIVVNDSKGDHSLFLPAAPWWLEHPSRREHHGVTFRPGEEREYGGALNLWQGWGINAIEGDWTLLKWHIREIFAGGKAEAADYALRWIAWAIQNLGERARVALVAVGDKGSGKGTVGRALRRIFNPYARYVSSPDEFLGNFNDHLKDCCFLEIDEAIWDAKKALGKLQAMITEDTLMLHPKYLGRYEVPNPLHMLFLAEPGWVVPAGARERRYAVFDTSDEKLGDKKYFKALHGNIDNGGAEAMLWDLWNMDLDGWHPSEIPGALLHSNAMQRQQLMSMPPFEQWVLGMLHNGQLPGPKTPRFGAAFTKSLSNDAKASVPKLQFMGDREMIRKLKDEWKCVPYHTNVGQCWRFPPLSDCRTAWERRYGPTAWDYPEAGEWEWCLDEAEGVLEQVMALDEK